MFWRPSRIDSEVMGHTIPVLCPWLQILLSILVLLAVVFTFTGLGVLIRRESKIHITSLLAGSPANLADTGVVSRQ